MKQALLHAKSSPSIFQCHSFQQDIDSESEEEDVVGASFDWTGDSTLITRWSSNFQIYENSKHKNCTSHSSTVVWQYNK